MATNKKPKQPKASASVSVWERYYTRLKEWEAGKKRKEDIKKKVSKVK